jgi:hypothetical protein
MIAIACDIRALEFFRGPVAERFYLLTGERLRAFPVGDERGRADFMVVSESVLRAGDDIPALHHGVGPNSFGGPSVALGAEDVGFKLDVGLDNDSPDVPELPDCLDFLFARDRDKLVLTAISESGFKRRGNHPFYYLFRLTNSIAHQLPFVPSLHFQHSITVGEQQMSV